MAKTFDQMMAEADGIIDQRAGSTKVAEAAVSHDHDDVVKLASLLQMDDFVQEKTAAAEFELSPLEKIAHAMAILDTVINIDEAQKITSFEKIALEKGHTQEQIDAVLEKRADKWKSIAQYVTIPGAVAAGGLGYVKGKKKGYNKALGDVNDAFSNYTPSSDA